MSAMTSSRFLGVRPPVRLRVRAYVAPVLRAAQPAAAWAGSLVAGAWLAAAAAAASRAAFQRLGSRSGRSLRRTRRASRGSTSRRYSTGLTSARRQQARMVYAIAARSPPASDPAKR